MEINYPEGVILGAHYEFLYAGKSKIREMTPARLQLIFKGEISISPVKLSVKWLERSGFERFENWGEYGAAFHLKGTVFYAAVSHKGITIDFNGTRIEQIKYLHQLEIAVYAMTGNKLIIKDKH